MKYIIVCFLLFFSQTTIAQEKPTDILSKMAAAIQSHESISYTVATSMKFFDDDDTVKLSGKVFLARDKDSVFGGNIWFTRNDTFFKFYDLHKIYKVNKKYKKVITNEPHKGETWGMTGNTDFDMVWTEFLKPEKINEKVESAENVTLLGDTIFKGHQCYRVLIQQPDEQGFTDRKRVYFIDKDEHIPYFSWATVKYQGNYQYEDFTLLTHTFDKVPASQFSAKQIPSDYAIEAYKRKEENDKLLDIGATAPAIRGKHYQHDLKEETLDYKGKITVLDFWYMACHPCVMAIPELEKVREKYKDNPRVQIIGVNSSDASEERIKKLPQFLEYNPIGYSFFLVDREIPNAFNVMAWPSFYIIDENGKVAYTTIGFDPEKLYSGLSEKIDEMLK